MGENEGRAERDGQRFNVRHAFWIVTALVTTIVLWRLWLFVGLAMDVAAVMGWVNNGGNAPGQTAPAAPATPARLNLAFMANSTPPANWDKSVAYGWFDVWAPAGKTTPVVDLASALAQIPDIASIEADIAVVTMKSLASPPTSTPNAFPHSFTAPAVNYRACREACRFWQAIGRVQAARGDGDAALVTMLGAALIANHLEARDPQGVSLISRMISCAVRNIAAQGLIEILPSLKLTRARAVEVLNWLDSMDRALGSAGNAFVYERSMLPSLAENMREAIRKGQAKSMYGRNPIYLAARLAEPGLLDTYLDPLYVPMINAATTSYPLVVRFLPGWQQQANVLLNRTTTPGWHWLGYAWSPENAFIDLLMGIGTPNMCKALQNDFVARARLRGVAVAYCATAYLQECATWPVSMAALASWTGRAEMPRDICSDQPMGYEVTVGAAPRLFSAGEDAQFNTTDDILFLPILALPQTLTHWAPVVATASVAVAFDAVVPGAATPGVKMPRFATDAEAVAASATLAGPGS